MIKRKKVYCGECKYYFVGRKNREKCLVAKIVTLPYFESYKSPPLKREEYCWEKNEKNSCKDFTSIPEVKP